MLRIIKVLILTFIISLFSFSYVQAMNINMNLSNNTTTTNSTNLSNNTSDIYAPINDDYSVSLSSMPEEKLSFGNILNIILIVIGVLLILLGIAIMIRLK